MRAVWSIGRGQLRRRRAATAALVLLVGLAGGVVMAAAAGAGRTDSAMRRFATYSRPEDVTTGANVLLQSVLRLDQGALAEARA